MSWTYFFDPNIAPGEYLDSAEFNRSLERVFKNPTSKLIASQRILSERYARQSALESLNVQGRILDAQSDLRQFRDQVAQANARQREALGTMVSDLRDDLQTMTLDLRDLGSELRWGVSRLNAALGSMGESLESLLAHVRTPSHTWAFEQFEMARHEHLLGHFDQALVNVDRAIEGYASHTGYRLDYRFHALKGLILMDPSFPGAQSGVRLRKSLDALATATGFAQNAPIEERERLFVARSWVHHLLSESNDALVMATNAVRLNPDSLQAQFQLARMSAAARLTEPCSETLTAVVARDGRYALKALESPEFAFSPGLVEEVVVRLMQGYRKSASDKLMKIDCSIQQFEDLHDWARYALRTDLHPEINAQREKLKALRDRYPDASSLQSMTLLDWQKQGTPLDFDEKSFLKLAKDLAERMRPDLLAGLAHTIEFEKTWRPEKPVGPFTNTEELFKVRALLGSLLFVYLLAAIPFALTFWGLPGLGFTKSSLISLRWAIAIGAGLFWLVVILIRVRQRDPAKAATERALHRAGLESVRFREIITACDELLARRV